MKKITIKATLLAEALGMSPANKEVYSEYIGSKAHDAASLEEEVDTLGAAAVITSGTTVFHYDKATGKPMWFDYQLRGFFKDTCSALARVPGTRSNKLKAFKKVIDGLIFVTPRNILITIPDKTMIGTCERPLVTNGPTGQRTALVRSQTVPEGSTFEFTVVLMDPTHDQLVLEWLDHGEWRGTGQWRNSGKGRFSYKVVHEQVVD